MPAGRYAPSPTGDLHLGNLRTAVLAWLLARRDGANFYLRIEDNEGVRSDFDQRQIASLKTIGIDWDGDVFYQSTQRSVHEAALATLQAKGLVFECYCSRKDIREAAQAPHGLAGDSYYPGTCRNLTDDERTAGRQKLAAQGRKPALRLNPRVDTYTVSDRLWGQVTTPIDCCVLRRGDGVIAYNLASVVDDATQGVSQVVRGDDLLHSSPAQAYIGHELGFGSIDYIHVPLVLNAEHKRLAKRDGAVTLHDLADIGVSVSDVLIWIGQSIGIDDDFATYKNLSSAEIMGRFYERFSLEKLTKDPVVLNFDVRRPEL